MRSPIVVYAQGEKEVTFFYAKLGMGGGYPRNIEWEQTGLISSHVECPDRVKHARSVFTKLNGIKGYCATISGEGACSDTAKAWPSTGCGFSTFKGFYSEGKFAGMEWPADTDAEAFPQSTHVTCNQDMCAHDVTAEGYSLKPVQFFVTWSGTDVGDRPLTSSGKSYQNSAQGFFKGTAESAGKLKEKCSSCIQERPNADGEWVCTNVAVTVEKEEQRARRAATKEHHVRSLQFGRAAQPAATQWLSRLAAQFI